MKRAALLHLALLTGLAAPAAVSAAPVKAFQTRLEEVNRPFGSQYWWVDAGRLVVPGIGARDGGNAAIYLVDLQAGTVGKLIDAANIYCTRPDKGVANVLLGKTGNDRLDRLVLHESMRPQPHRWDGRQARLVPAAPGEALPSPACVTAEEFQAQVNRRSDQDNTTVPLPAWHAKLRVAFEQGNPARVLFEPAGTGRPPTPVDVPPEGLLTPEPIPYFAFQDEYLLGTGLLMKRQADGGSASQETERELPLTTLTRKGELRKATFEPYFKRLGVPAPEYLALPYARGTLLLASGWRNAGAGVYTVNQGRLQKRWCTASGAADATDPKCDIDGFQLSPDGCAVAFYSSTTFGADGTPRESTNRELIVLPLCSPTVRPPSAAASRP